MTVGQRTLLFTLLFPGSVVGLVPLWILHAHLDVGSDWLAPRLFAGIAVAAAGVAIYAVCAREFVTRGRGTPAPYDPALELVVSGLYCRVRNPMYVGIVAIVAGEALVFVSWPLAIFAGCLAVGFHVRVVGYEERALARQFGEAFARYRATVPRWLPRLRVSRPATGAHRVVGGSAAIRREL